MDDALPGTTALAGSGIEILKVLECDRAQVLADQVAAFLRDVGIHNGDNFAALQPAVKRLDGQNVHLNVEVVDHAHDGQGGLFIGDGRGVQYP